MFKVIFKSLIKVYNYTSIFFGIIIPILCFQILPDINILEDPLSIFGIKDDTKILWISFNILISLSILSIGYESNKMIKDIENNKLLNVINYLSVVSLILSAIINMNFRILHLTFASIFFLLSTLYIFLYGYFYKNIRYSVSLLSMFVVSINTILILLVFYFDISYGLFEVFFILNLITLYLFMIKKVIK
jgi:hypothetical protein